ncbi:MAG: DUF5343 domain-containing protein [Patescibacteria group bacterium]
MNEKEKPKTVPYLSASKMEKVLELVSERSLQNVSPLYFKSYGFGDADAYLAMNVLRFLKLVDENDKPTELARKFQLKGEARNKEVEASVKEAYKGLFTAVEKPYQLPKDDLANEFMHNYSLSKRVAESAVPAFLKLCEFAGLVEQGSVLVRRRKQKTETSHVQKKKEQRTKQGIAIKADGDYTPVPFAGGEVKLLLPTEILTRAILDNELGSDLKKVTSAISDFASKHFKSDKHESNEQEEISKG